MRILFCDNTCPGSFGNLPGRLAESGAHEVMFLSFYPRDGRATPGVIHARLRLDRSAAEEKDPFLAAWHKGFRLGRQAFHTFRHIRDSGFVPDMILVTFFDGPAFFLRHVFPEAFLVSYFGALRFRSGEERSNRLAALLDMQKFQALQSDVCFVRSEAQKRLFPALLHPRIHVLAPFVDTDFFSPGHGDIRQMFPQAGEDAELVTFHMKGQWEPQWAYVPLGLLMRRKHCFAALSCGGSSLRQKWESVALPEEVRARMFFASGMDSAAYRTLLCSSHVHAFPEYADPPLQETLESMSCGALAMLPLSGGEQGIFKAGVTAAALPAGRAEEQIQALCRVLDHRSETERMRENGRRAVVELCAESSVLNGHLAFIMECYAAFLSGKQF